MGKSEKWSVDKEIEKQKEKYCYISDKHISITSLEKLADFISGFSYTGNIHYHFLYTREAREAWERYTQNLNAYDYFSLVKIMIEKGIFTEDYFYSYM